MRKEMKIGGKIEAADLRMIILRPLRFHLFFWSNWSGGVGGMVLLEANFSVKLWLLQGPRNRLLHYSHSKKAHSVVTNCDTCDESGYDRANGKQNDRLDLMINKLSWWTIGSGRYRSIKLTRLPPQMNISSSRIPDFFRKSEFWPKVWFLPFFEDHVDSYCFFRFFFVRRFLMPQLFCLLSWGVSLKSFFEPQ